MVQPAENIQRFVVAVILLIACNYPINRKFITLSDKRINQFRILQQVIRIAVKVSLRTTDAADSVLMFVFGIDWKALS